MPIPSAIPAHLADRMAAPSDDDEIAQAVAESRRADLVLDLIECISDSDLCEIVRAKLESDPFLLTSLRNMARMSALSLHDEQIRAMMVRFAATAGDSIRYAVDYAEGDDLVEIERRRLREDNA